MINYDINKTYIIMTVFMIFVVWCCICNWCIRKYIQTDNEDIVGENLAIVLPNDNPPKYEEINENFE